MSDHFGIEKELLGGAFLKLAEGEEAEVTFLPGCTKREQVFSNGKFEKFDPKVHSEADKKVSYNFNLIHWEHDGNEGTVKRFGASTGAAKNIAEACKAVPDLNEAIFRLQREGSGPKTRYLVKKLSKKPNPDAVKTLTEGGGDDDKFDDIAF